MATNMKTSFYAGTAGLVAQQHALDIISNNLANANTNGYLSQDVSFGDLLRTKMDANTPTAPTVGCGVRATSGGLQIKQSPMMQTGSFLDFAISGDGFFAVDTGTATQYTRCGSFALKMDGDTPYLATQSGQYVLDEDGDLIELKKVKDNTPNNSGESSGGYDYSALQKEIGVYQFPNASALLPVSGNLYAATAESGRASAIEDGSRHILQGFIEGSGTSMVDGMTDMLSTQRAYQMSARVVQMADEIEQTVNNLRK